MVGGRRTLVEADFLHLSSFLDVANQIEVEVD